MNANENSRSPTISRRKFLWLAAAGLLAACRPSPQPTDAGEKPTTTEPTRASAATSPPPTQAPDPTEEPEPAGDLPAILGRLHWLGHASFRLDGPPTIYFDPTSLGSDDPPADVILVSHDHNDHMSTRAIGSVSGPETVIVTTQRVAEQIEAADVTYAELRVAQPGERVTVGEIEIETVPAYNIEKPYHPKESGHLGFVVTQQGEQLYFAGDTERIPEMADIDCDVALLPVGGTYTMDIEEAAQAAADIGPKVVVPMHNRSADLDAFSDLCACPVVVMEIE